MNRWHIYMMLKNNTIPSEDEINEMESLDPIEIKEGLLEWLTVLRKDYYYQNRHKQRRLTRWKNVRAELALKLEDVIRARAKENKVKAMAKARKNNPNNKDEQFYLNSEKTVTTSTDKELAKIAGVSKDTIWKTTY